MVLLSPGGEGEEREGEEEDGGGGGGGGKRKRGRQGEREGRSSLICDMFQTRDRWVWLICRTRVLF